jgi:hypothetical protein
MIRRAEAQRVHRRDGPCAHGEDIAQDAADAGRRALVGLDVGGVVVAFHLEDHASPSPISTTPAFSPGPWMTRGPVGRQGFQPLLRGFVGTVLVPHGRKDAELGEGRLTADQIENALVFVGLELRGQQAWAWLLTFCSVATAMALLLIPAGGPDAGAQADRTSPTAGTNSVLLSFIKVSGRLRVG